MENIKIHNYKKLGQFKKKNEINNETVNDELLPMNLIISLFL